MFALILIIDMHLNVYVARWLHIMCIIKGKQQTINSNMVDELSPVISVRTTIHKIHLDEINQLLVLKIYSKMSHEFSKMGNNIIDGPCRVCRLPLSHVIGSAWQKHLRIVSACRVAFVHLPLVPILSTGWRMHRSHHLACFRRMIVFRFTMYEDCYNECKVCIT